MKFTLDAGGAQQVGTGLGNIFKAYVLGPQIRQQAQQQAEALMSKTYANTQAGNKYGAEAKGLEMTNAAREAPIDMSLPEYLQLSQKVFQLTGDNNAERVANAATEYQTQGIRDKAVGAIDNLDQMNRFNTLAKPGEVYMPFKAVGETGAAMNQATGDQRVVDEALRKLFGDKVGSEILENKAQANSSNASASKYTAETEIERLKGKTLKDTGALPGTGREASEGALSSTIIQTLQVPAVDEKGRTVRNPITGEIETTLDQDALTNFYKWTDANNRKPTATAFSQWESKGRPSGIALPGQSGDDKNPAPAQSQPKIEAAPKEATQRKAGTVYQTPKGPLKWTGTGWLPAN